MSIYEGASALVTGAGSGIGLALSRALVARGAHVWLADVDATAVKAAAEGLGARAHWGALDVRDAEAVRRTVARVEEEGDGLDLLFNNAGIGVGGETHELSAAHFDRCIDVNIRGVTNGVVAAYPRMVARGRGIIVNTASAAGLFPVPLLTPYAMTKHAVVGLSRSLRIEAERHGVKVVALCPAAIETPLLDRDNPEDLAGPWRPDVRSYLTRFSGAPWPVEAFADYALDRIAANRGIVVAPRFTRFAVWLSRIAPALVTLRTRQVLAEVRSERPPESAS